MHRAEGSERFYKYVVERDIILYLEEYCNIIQNSDMVSQSATP